VVLRARPSWELVGGKRVTLFAGILVATVLLFAEAPGVYGHGEAVLTSIGSVLLIGGAVMTSGTWPRTSRWAALMLVPIVVLTVLTVLTVLLATLPLALNIAVLTSIWYSAAVVAVLAVVGTPRWVRAGSP
jgi:hypothetical protein